jgi:hypothetical protein
VKSNNPDWSPILDFLLVHFFIKESYSKPPVFYYARLIKFVILLCVEKIFQGKALD